MVGHCRNLAILEGRYCNLQMYPEADFKRLTESVKKQRIYSIDISSPPLHLIEAHKRSIIVGKWN